MNALLPETVTQSGLISDVPAFYPSALPPLWQHRLINSHIPVCNFLPQPTSLSWVSYQWAQAPINQPMQSYLLNPVVSSQPYPGMSAQATPILSPFLTPAHTSPSDQMSVLSGFQLASTSWDIDHGNNRNSFHSTLKHTLKLKRHWQKRVTPYLRPNHRQQNKQNWSNSSETIKSGAISSGNENRTRKSMEATTPYIYDSDKNKVLKLVKSLQGKASKGKLLFLRNDHRAGLGYISIHPYYIKFDFSIDTTKVILPLYRNRDQLTFIKGIFDSDQSEVANYINRQPLNAFRNLSLQKEAGEIIPIHMRVTSLFQLF